MSDPGTAPRSSDLSLGVDIGGTKILAGLVDHDGRVVERRQVPTRPGHVTTDTVEACRDLLEWAGKARRRIAGIGVGAKGAVDRERGVLVGSLYLGHGEVPLGAHLHSAFALPIRIENDVHAATIGEQVFGVGRQVDDFLFYNAGTGIAIGVVAGGRLYRGASNTAGENGHAVIDHTGRWPCPCGLSGCIETVIIAGRRGATVPSCPGLTADAAGRDPAYALLASSVLDMTAIFDPAAVVLAGGMLTAGNAEATWLKATLIDRLPPGIAVRPAFAGADAGLIGAAAVGQIINQSGGA